MIVLFWCVVSLVVILILLTMVPVRYSICGRLQDTVRFEIEWQYGPLSGMTSYSSKQLQNFKLSFIGIPVGGKAGKQDVKKDQNTIPKRIKVKKEKAGFAINDLRCLLNKDFLAALLKMLKTIYRHSRPGVWNISGVIGFNDPYYTGLFAAARQALPGIGVEPDFSREIYDITVQISGRIIAFALSYHTLRFLGSRAARLVLARLWKARKSQKKSGSISRYKSVQVHH